MPPPLTITPIIKLDGAALAVAWQDALLDLRIEREFQVPSRCSLRFVDPGYELLSANKVKLGSVVKVEGRNGAVLVEAEVTSVTVDQRPFESPELVVVAHDKGHRLGRSTTVATFVKMTYSDIVSKIAQENGLTASVDATSMQLEYLLQVDSDLGLVTELANRVGYDWWVEGSALKFKKPVKSAPITLNLEHGEIDAFSVKASGHHPTAVKVDGWDRQKQETVTATAPASGAAITPTSTFADLVQSPAAAFGAATLVSASLAAASQNEANELSKAVRDRVVAAAVTAKGEMEGDARIKPGISVKVEKAGPLSGEYHVTKVEHLYRPQTGFRTRFVAGDRAPTTLVDTLGGRPSPSGGAAAFSHPGLVVGEVTNINDPEKLGRVKVRYPGLSSNEESAWARIVAVGGGAKRGTVFIPEVKDEVLVGFEGGDPRQPVVFGGLYGDKSGIPQWDVDAGKVQSRRLTSRLGHVVELADGSAPAEQHVMLQLAGEKHKFRLGKDRVDLEVPAGSPVSVKAGSTSIVFANNGDVTIEGVNITLKAKANVKIEAGANVEVKGNAMLKLEGAAQAAMKGAMTQIDGTGTLILKGGMVQIN